MAYVIITRHGLKQNLPASAPVGELFETTDTHELFVGTGTGLAQIAANNGNATSINGTPVLDQDPNDGQILIFDETSGDYVPGDPIVSGPDAPGVPPTRNPVQVGIFDGTDVRRLKGDSSGVASVNVQNLPMVQRFPANPVIQQVWATGSIGLTATLPNPVRKGSTLVAIIPAAPVDADPTTVSDNLSNTYVQEAAGYTFDNNFVLYMFVATDVAEGLTTAAVDSIDIANLGILLLELDASYSAVLLDGQNTNLATGTGLTTGAIQTSGDYDVLLGAALSTVPELLTIGGSFTELQNSPIVFSSGPGFSAGFIVLRAPTSQAMTWTKPSVYQSISVALALRWVGEVSTIVGNFPAVQPISAAALPLPLNAAIENGGNLTTIRGAVQVAGGPVPPNLMMAGIQDGSGNAQPVSPSHPLPVLIAATVAVSAAALPLPAGAATEASLGTDGATPPSVPGTGIRGWLRSIYDKLAGTLSVSGTFWQTTQPVSVASVPLPTGASTSANQATAQTSLSSIDTKTPALASGRVPVDASGVTVPVSIAATVAVSAAALPLPAGAATEASLGTDGATPPSVPGTGIRGWLRSIYDKLAGTLAVSGTFWQATQPVSAASLPLPTGASTSANQATAQTSIASIDTKTPALASGRVPVDASGVTVPVSIAATVAVSAAALPLPAGAATEASLGTDGATPPSVPGTGIRGWLRSIYDKLAGTLSVSGTFWQATQPVAGTLTHNSAAPTTNNLGVLPAVANQIPPVLLEGDQVLLSTDLSGNLRTVDAGVPTVVQKAAFGSTGSVSSLACAFPSNVKKGDTLIIIATAGGSSGLTISDTLGNVYLGAGAYQLGPASAFGIGAYWCKSKASGANTITVTNLSAAASIAAEIYEVTGLAPGIAPEAFSSISATQASVITGSAATQTIPNGFVVFGVAVGTAAQAITLPVVTSPAFSNLLANDSGQINPTTPAGVFSFAAGSAVSPLPQTFATNAPVALLAGSEPFASVFCVFRPYIQAASGVSTIFGQGTAPLVTNMVPVSIIDGNAPGDGTATSGSILAPNATHQVLSVGVWAAQDGSNTKFVGLRTPNIFKTIANVAVTAGTGVTLWTPTSGKKFRLMGYCISLSVAGRVIFGDNAIGTEIFRTCDMAAAIGHESPKLGNGFLSAAANNVLKADVSATGNINGFVFGTEE